MRNKYTQIYFELKMVMFIFIVMTFYKHATCLNISVMSWWITPSFNWCQKDHPEIIQIR